MDTTVAYSSLLLEFKSAPPGKLYCLHGTKSVFRMSLAAAAHVLLNGLTVALVDGTNRFDAYYLAEFARRHAGTSPGARPMTPEDFLDRIHVSRAFTCYQMEAVITERLPAFVRRTGTPVVIVFGLLDTFYDEQAPLFEVKAGVRRMVKALRTLRNENVAVLLASTDVRPASKERSGLFPALMTAMDEVYSITQTEGGERILKETTARYHRGADIARGAGRYYGPDDPDIHHGDPAGNGELGKIPERVAQGGPGRA